MVTGRGQFSVIQKEGKPTEPTLLSSTKHRQSPDTICETTSHLPRLRGQPQSGVLKELTTGMTTPGQEAI
eukprot:scaffold98383_cov20-Prasinocladus_malaysianus.AAC.1